MKRLLSSFVMLVALSGPLASAQPNSPTEPQQGSPQQTAEWVKEMHNDALQMMKEGDDAMGRGDERMALNRYVAAHEIYKAALSAEELKDLAGKIEALRAKLGEKGHEAQPETPKAVDLNDPATASKRTDALRMLSEAEQYLDEGRNQEAGRLYTRLYARFRPVLMTDEEKRVTQGLMTSRERLGLPALPPGQEDFLPYIAKSGDEEIDSLCLLISGSFRTSAQSSDAEKGARLVFNSAAVPVDGLTNAVYFEVAREDDLPNPFRQGLITFYRLDQQLRLRVLDIPTPGVRSVVVGLWAATDVFPVLKLDSLSVNADLAMTRADDGSGYTARTTGRAPTVKGGAVFMTSQFKVSSDGITIDDRGYDAGGKEVWRSGNESGVAFLRTASPNIVKRRDSGVVVIDLAPGTGDEGLKKGGELAMHFSYWAATGTMVGTSRFGERQPQRVRFPVSFIPGLDEGLDGITEHTHRRFVIPPEMAWGAKGNGWQVPPNTPVIFDVECLWVQAPMAPPTPTPPPSAGTQGPPSPAAAPGQRPSGGGH
jgi:hypothetical protein